MVGDHLVQLHCQVLRQLRRQESQRPGQQVSQGWLDEVSHDAYRVVECAKPSRCQRTLGRVRDETPMRAMESAEGGASMARVLPTGTQLREGGRRRALQRMEKAWDLLTCLAWDRPGNAGIASRKMVRPLTLRLAALRRRHRRLNSPPPSVVMPRGGARVDGLHMAARATGGRTTVTQEPRPDNSGLLRRVHAGSAWH